MYTVTTTPLVDESGSTAVVAMETVRVDLFFFETADNELPFRRATVFGRNEDWKGGIGMGGLVVVCGGIIISSSDVFPNPDPLILSVSRGIAACRRGGWGRARWKGGPW